MYFVSQVHCSNEWVDGPDLFLIKLTDSLLETLQLHVEAARLAREHSANLHACQFLSIGEWIMDCDLAESVLGGDTHRLVEDSLIPEEFDATVNLVVRGEVVFVYPDDGSLTFTAYNRYTGNDITSENVCLKDLIEGACPK